MRSIDPFDDALADLRITGSVLLNESYLPPWSIVVPDEAALRAMMGVDPRTRVIAFHFVREGEFDLQFEDRKKHRVQQHDVALNVCGKMHRMTRGKASRDTSLKEVLARQTEIRVPNGTPGATELICGVFCFRAAPLNPLLAALPGLTQVSTSDASNAVLRSVSTLLTQQIALGLGHGFSATRLLEIFCAEALRATQLQRSTSAGSWFNGLQDARISSAISHMHAAPERAWSVAQLAEIASLSSSRFAASFKQTTGNSVIEYLTHWRINVACRMLQETNRPVAEIAEQVGYNGLPAFTRAFKNCLGAAPAKWRNQVKASVAAP